MAMIVMFTSHPDRYRVFAESRPGSRVTQSRNKSRLTKGAGNGISQSALPPLELITREDVCMVIWTTMSQVVDELSRHLNGT